jgi:ABC-type transport system substrate-binding protein
VTLAAVLVLAGCTERPWNDPHPPAAPGKKVIYGAFSERPKHLDPARAYSSDEYRFIAQIYEPPLQYHYLKRPYELVPLSATSVPTAQAFDGAGHPLPEDAPGERVDHTVYELRISPGIRYQPHPALARGANGDYLYHDLAALDLEDIHTVADFPRVGTRELTAADYAHQIKRLAHPEIHSPILGLMRQYILGLDALARELAEVHGADPNAFIDLTRFPLEGAEAVDRYTLRIKLAGRYPQFVYWLAMPFFAPVPPEADRFYGQPGMRERNLSLDWHPLGTGPFMLAENNPNRRMVLVRNPEFRGEPYPIAGEPEDAAAGWLADAGRAMPFVDRAIYSLEKENIPYWTKFQQGYYDSSGITSDSFDQAVRMTNEGDARLTDRMQAKGIELVTAVSTSVFYFGFNMLDPVVGGLSEQARKLRRAIAIAIDWEEFIDIFANGRGIPAQGPLPPGIFGHRDGPNGINPYVYHWVNGRPQRKPLSEAMELLAEAGYPEGIDPETGKPLLLYFDAVGRGPDEKARLDWYRKQFRKLGMQLVIRATDYNRFRDKMLNATAQMFYWGWNADYPDPENFFFLLHGPQAKAISKGENAANYRNPEFDELFSQMKYLANGPRRQAVIDGMLEIVRRDSPWVFGFHPKDFSLHHAWLHNVKPNLMANNTLKYRRVDPELRAQRQREWNRPVLWPLYLVAGLAAVFVLPAAWSWWRREHATPEAAAR